MHIHADLNQRAVDFADEAEWVQSPSGGCEQRMLELRGGEEDRYPAGTWLRNPPGSRHRPFSLDGCLILVMTGHLATAYE